MKKKLLFISIGLGVIILVVIFLIYKALFGTGITQKENNSIIYIPTGSKFEDVMKILNENNVLKNSSSLEHNAAGAGLPSYE